MDQPRDIHGTPLYVGDRVAIATVGGHYGSLPILIVRVVTEVLPHTIRVPELDGHDGLYSRSYAKRAFLRLA